MVFIFKEEIFQLSIHYLYLNNNIYNIIRNYNSFKLLAPCSGIRKHTSVNRLIYLLINADETNFN